LTCAAASVDISKTKIVKKKKQEKTPELDHFAADALIYRRSGNQIPGFELYTRPAS
jgi:hypothetical protein